MGNKKRMTARFLAQNPTCYFCGGVAVTKDHVPSRQCFYDRVWPEGYEFPACEPCNASAKGIEQVVALYLHMANHDGRPPTKQFHDMVAGVRNNTPQYLPTTNITTNMKKRALRELGHALPAFTSAASAPVVQLPPENRAAFELFERRLTCALF